MRNGNEGLIINFNWPDGYTSVVQTDSCYDITILSRWPTNFWGFKTEMYSFTFGFWCEGMEDTLWVLTQFRTNRMFGCELGYDGWIRGAFINGTTYGTLHPLPVALVSFAAEVTGNNVILNWSTANEVNNKGFEILRCAQNDMNKWITLGFVEGSGTTIEFNSYSFTDDNLTAGKYHYRLKQIDFDGTFEYSYIIEAEILAPGEFFLYQNYPNPFNPTTKLSFVIGHQSFVTLKVNDLLGREVAKLVDEEKPAGYYEVEFDASDLSSGFYVYQLRAGNHIESKKMILVK